MKFLRYVFLILAIPAAVISMPGCIEDSISTSPADQPDFSTDTVRFGEQFTGEMTSTMMLKVYNRHNKIISINDIWLDGADASDFRLNVDGQTGERFSNVEIRPNDSIYVLVSARFGFNEGYEPETVSDKINFSTNGVTRSVVVTAESRNVETLTDVVIVTDTRFDAATPRRIFGTLTVAEGATLTLEAGATLYFHDKSSLLVEGCLICEGAPDGIITMRGDRLGSVVGEIPFDLMASQWGGVRFTPRSVDNLLSFTEIRNTTYGVIADTTEIALTNCRLRNSASTAMRSNHSTLTAVGCEFAEAAVSPLVLNGGDATIVNCTLSNYYLFSAISGPLLMLGHTDSDHTDTDPATEEPSTLPYLKARVQNSILYGAASDMNRGNLDDTDVYISNSLLRGDGKDDEHFIDILWGADPLFYTVRSEYVFDYRIHPDSPAIGLSKPALLPLPPTDFYGAPRNEPAPLGAYQPWDGDTSTP